MPAALVTVTLENLTSFTDESTVSTFAFASDVAITNTVQLDMQQAVADFFTVTQTTAARSVGSFIAGHVDRSAQACRLRVYDISNTLDGSPHGSPIGTGYFTMPAATAAPNLPAQCAGVLTLRSSAALNAPVEGPADTRPRARQTGRLYVGPLAQDAVTGSTTTPARLSTSFRNTVLEAAEKLQDDLVDGDYQWGVWSRANQQVVNINRVEMDDSVDVIRSRKLRPTVRDVRTFAPVPALILAS